MNLIKTEEYLELRSELNEYVVLCNKYNYTPSKSEFDDIIRFILLYQNGGTTLCENYELNPFKLLNHLYESYGFDESNVVLEAGEGQTPYDPEKDFDSAYGSVKTGVAMAGVAAAAAVVGAAKLIQYFFKKKKIKKACDAELEAEKKKLQGGWIELSVKKKKLAAITGETTKIDWPGMATAPGDEGGDNSENSKK